MHNMSHGFGRFLMTVSALSAVVVLCLSPSVQADDDHTQYNGKEFELAIKRSVKENVDTKIKTSKGSVLAVKNLEWIDTGQWKIFINGAWGTGSDRIQILTYPGIMVNHGDRFEYVFYGQPVPEHLVEGIRNHKGMLKAEKAWKKKYKDVSFDVGVDGNRITLKVAGSYANGLKERHLVERMKYIWNASNGILVWTYHASDDVEKDYVKNLTKNGLTHLSKVDFLVLTGDGLSEVEKENKEATEGYWSFKNKGRNFRMFNYGDRAMLTYYREIPDSVTGDDRAEVLAKVQKFVEKNKVKNAHSQEARWYNNKKEKFVWVRVNYEFDGKLKGEKFKEGYWDFKDKFATKLDKEIDKILKKYE